MKNLLLASILTLPLFACSNTEAPSKPLANPSSESVAALSFVYNQADGDIQHVIDTLAAHSTLVFDKHSQIVLNKSLVLNQPIRLDGLNAKFATQVNTGPMVIINAPQVTIENGVFHGNYEPSTEDSSTASLEGTATQESSLIVVNHSTFTLRNLTLHNSPKHGIEIIADDNGISDGNIEDISAHNIKRSALYIASNNQNHNADGISPDETSPALVDNIKVKNLYLYGSSHSGAVTLKNTTQDIVMNNIYAQDSQFAIDIFESKTLNTLNNHIIIDKVTAKNCQFAVRANYSQMHDSGLLIKNVKASHCQRPIELLNISDVEINGLTVLAHHNAHYAPLSLDHCQDITLINISIQSQFFDDNPILSKNCLKITYD